jgi:hypothetical protein
LTSLLAGIESATRPLARRVTLDKRNAMAIGRVNAVTKQTGCGRNAIRASNLAWVRRSQGGAAARSLAGLFFSSRKFLLSARRRGGVVGALQ